MSSVEYDMNCTLTSCKKTVQSFELVSDNQQELAYVIVLVKVGNKFITYLSFSMFDLRKIFELRKFFLMGYTALYNLTDVIKKM